jgi:hypothetical protein
LKGGVQSGHEKIAAAFESRQARLLQLQGFMSTSSVGREMHYRDDIHISDPGQAALAVALDACVADAR